MHLWLTCGADKKSGLRIGSAMIAQNGAGGGEVVDGCVRKILAGGAAEDLGGRGVALGQAVDEDGGMDGAGVPVE